MTFERNSKSTSSLAFMFVLVVMSSAFFAPFGAAASEGSTSISFIDESGANTTGPLQTSSGLLSIRVKSNPQTSCGGSFKFLVDGVIDAGTRYVNSSNCLMYGQGTQPNVLDLRNLGLSLGSHLLRVTHFDRDGDPWGTNSIHFSYDLEDKSWWVEGSQVNAATITGGLLEITYRNINLGRDPYIDRAKCLDIADLQGIILKSSCWDVRTSAPIAGTAVYLKWAMSMTTWQIPNGLYSLKIRDCDSNGYSGDYTCAEQSAESAIPLTISQPGEPVSGTIQIQNWISDAKHPYLKFVTLASTAAVSKWCFYMDNEAMDLNFPANNITGETSSLSGYTRLTDSANPERRFNSFVGLSDRIALANNCMLFGSGKVTLDARRYSAGSHVLRVEGSVIGLYSPNPLILNTTVNINSITQESSLRPQDTTNLDLVSQTDGVRLSASFSPGLSGTYLKETALFMDGVLLVRSSNRAWEFSPSTVKSGRHVFRLEFLASDGFVSSVEYTKSVLGFAPSSSWSENVASPNFIGEKVTAKLALDPVEERLPAYVESRFKVGLGSWSKWKKHTKNLSLLIFPFTLNQKVAIQVKIPGVNGGATTYTSASLDSSPKISISSNYRTYGTGSRYTFKVQSEKAYRGNCSWKVYEAPSRYWDNHTSPSLPIRMFGNTGTFTFRTIVAGGYKLMANCGGKNSPWSLGVRTKLIYVLPAN